MLRRSRSGIGGAAVDWGVGDTVMDLSGQGNRPHQRRNSNSLRPSECHTQPVVCVSFWFIARTTTGCVDCHAFTSSPAIGADFLSGSTVNHG